MLKIDIIDMAYAHILISGITLGPTNEDIDIALDILEDMAWEFYSRNICTGYNFQDEPNPNDEAEINRLFANAFKTNLAIRLLAAFGKVPPQTLVAQANQSLSNMSARTAKVRQVSYPNRQPRGSANSLRFNRWRRYYLPEEKESYKCYTKKELQEISMVKNNPLYNQQNTLLETLIKESVLYPL